mgnify:CR=1 FL=1
MKVNVLPVWFVTFTLNSANGLDSTPLTSDNVNPVSFFQPKEAQVSDVSGMLSSARPSSDISMVQINEVPDYSGLMKNLMSKGAI